MSKYKRKKSMNWYDLHPRFSIRKYHFGAASVLLGVALALTGGAEVSATTTDTSASTTPSSAIVTPSSTTTDTSVSTTPSSTTDLTMPTSDVSTATSTSETASSSAAEEVTPSTSETSSTSATDTASTSTPTSSITADAPAATTTASASTPKIAVPTTIEEAKVVLEQIVSEAEVLANEGSRNVATDTTSNTSSLKVTAEATKLAATDARVVLEDAEATLEQVNTQIKAIRSNVDALVLELRKYYPDGEIALALDTSISSGLKVGEGEGLLVDKSTTATPSMDDANGARITANHTLATGVTSTSKTGWYTFDSYDLTAYNRNQPSIYINGTKLAAYMRYSLNEDPANLSVLAELVSTTNGQVLEEHIIDPGHSVEFAYQATVDPDNETIVVEYNLETYTEGSIYGAMKFHAVKDGKTATHSMLFIPVHQQNVTRYVVDDGRELATYTLQTIAGQTVAPSGVRDFTGFDYVKNTTNPVQGSLPVGTVVLAGKVQNNTVKYKALRRVVANDAYVTEIYVADPRYDGPLDWDGIDTAGFYKLLETSPLSYFDGTNYNYNKSSILWANGTYDPASGYIVFYESPQNDQGSKYRTVAQWSGDDVMGLNGRIFIGTQVWTTAQELNDYEMKWRGVRDKFDNKGYIPFGIQQYLRGAVRPTASETTYVYKAIQQEAIIRYKVEGATDYLEDSGILTGGSGTDINYSTEKTINKYKKLGYELVSDNFTISGGQDYDSNPAVLQEFLVVIKPRVVDVPKGVVPGKPVDPTDPNSPVWPDTVNNLETTQEVTRTVKYKYEDGTPVRVDTSGKILSKDSTEGTQLVKIQTVTFSRPAQVNLVTGEITYGEWSADSTDVLSGNLIPEITDYTATRTTLEGVDAPMTETVKDKTVAATDEDINEVVYFKENPKYGDVVVNYVNTNGKVIATPVVDTNDALVGTDYSTADRVPKKIIEDATGDVYYYKEIKAEDAAKESGKVVEGTTEVTYVYEKAGSVVVNYVTEDGTVIKAPVQDETNVPAGKSYDTTDNKPTEIVTEDGTTYELVRVDGSEIGTVEGGKTTEVTYVYRKVTPAKKVVTNHVDEDGNPIAPQEDGTTPNKSIPGYEFTGKTITDKDGNTTHIYHKINDSVKPTPPTAKTPSTPKPNAPAKASGMAQLPNTGESSSAVVPALGAGMLLASLGLVGKRRKENEE
ncbi:MucBP domain-containing protein [Streptococcus dysgalactiae]|uniref:MucBP domain-containing protein n=1 Tax=Streptococcus dysgalactiae TaxID=1334 RepID=UPI0010CAB297|nr:MucBP domain-containing protein [Streptococcus dysgalactiae]VTT02047.1 muramidase-released protein [Streptococcus dysgalactiae]